VAVRRPLCHRLVLCVPAVGGVGTRFLLNRLYGAIRSAGQVIDCELLFGVMDPGLVYDRRDPAREHPGGYVARVVSPSARFVNFPANS